MERESEMSKGKKLLSIIVPSYNMEKYLPKCLGSLIVEDAALLTRLDVIVVNDGSKDRTSEIAHEFEARYPGVFRVIDKPNGNYGSCINAALKVAAGRFVKILDADDTYDTEAFEQYLRQIDGMPLNTDMVMNDFIEVDETGAVGREITFQLPTTGQFTPDLLVQNKCPMAMHAVAYRTELLREINYTQLEGISYTDTEWFYLPAANAKCISYIPLKVYRYLFGRAGQTMEKTTWLKNCWMMDKIFNRMARQYDEKKEDNLSRAYLEAQLLRMFSLIHNLHMDESTRSQRASYFKMIAPYMDKFDFILQRMRQPILFPRMPFRFHYLEFVIRHPVFEKPVFTFVAWYNTIRSKI